MKEKKKISRRSFIKTIGTSFLFSTAVKENIILTPVVEAKEALIFPNNKRYLFSIILNVNEIDYKIEVEPRETLLSVLRDRLGLTGTKLGCNMGECGACTIIMEDKAVLSCSILAVQANSKKILTIEGIMKNGKLHKIQEAIMKKDALQCGFCTPGQIMSLYSLFIQNQKPTKQEILDALAANLCRCGSYNHLIKAATDIFSLT